VREETYRAFDDLFPDRDASFRSEGQCHLCADDGREFIGQPVIWGNGPRDALIMAVGRDSSGLYADEPRWRGSRGTGIPFTNKKSGLKLRVMLHQAGIDPSSVFFTNVVKCNSGYPDGCSLAVQRRLWGVVRQSCVRHLRDEVEAVRPRVVITLGGGVRDAFAELLPRTDAGCDIMLDTTELLKGSLPYMASIGEGRVCCVVNLKHPSRVEGDDRETRYIANLRAIRDFISREGWDEGRQRGEDGCG